MDTNYYEKYLKYKNKYLLLKNQLGGNKFILEYETMEKYIEGTGVYTIQNYDIIRHYLTTYTNDVLLIQNIVNIINVFHYKDANNDIKNVVIFKNNKDSTIFDNFIGNISKDIDQNKSKDIIKALIKKETSLHKRLYNYMFFIKDFEIYTPQHKIPRNLLPIEKSFLKNYRKIYDYNEIISEIINNLLKIYNFVVLFKDKYISFKELLESLQSLKGKNLLEEDNLKYMDLYILYQELLALYYNIFITFEKDSKIDKKYLNENKEELKVTNINKWCSDNTITKYYLLFLLINILDKDDTILDTEISKYYQDTKPTDKIIDHSLFSYKLYDKNQELIKYYIHKLTTTKKFYMYKKDDISQKLISKEEFIDKIKNYRKQYSLEGRNIYNKENKDPLIVSNIKTYNILIKNIN